jgi:hypothetical protein
MAKGIKSFFVYLLAIYTTLLKNMFSSFAHILIRLSVIWGSKFLSSLYILNINSMW